MMKMNMDMPCGHMMKNNRLDDKEIYFTGRESFLFTLKSRL